MSRSETDGDSAPELTSQSPSTSTGSTPPSDDPHQNFFEGRYHAELQQFSLGYEEVQRLALTSGLRVSRLRSLAWAILFEVLPPRREEWLIALRKNRAKYDKLKTEIFCDPHENNKPEDDPLSQDNESLWNQHFLDNDLKSIIKLDVIRTFPGVEFFSDPAIQESMINVLFIYARETPKLKYRQGMHEVLAPIIFVLQSDYQAAEHASTMDEVIEIMDPKYLEHDSYALFSVIMKGIKKFYTVKEIAKLSLKPTPANAEKKYKITRNQIIGYLSDTPDSLLSKEDPALAAHLRQSDISMSIFGIRWLRLLFGREFPLHDLLLLWDIIFAYRDFSLTGYVMVAMLITIKTTLMNSEPITCLTYLLHYPTTVDVQYVIDYALFLKFPKDYCRPITRQPMYIMKNSTSTHHRRIFTDKNKHSRKPVGHIKVKNVKERVGTPANDPGIIDGTALQEVNLREELFHAYSLIETCNTKLEQYEEVLRHTLPGFLPLSHPAYQAIKGLKEVSDLLKSRQMVQIFPDVEPALEANESANIPKIVSKKTNDKHRTVQRAPDPPKEVPLTLYNLTKTLNGTVEGPNTDPLGLRSD